MLRELVLAGFTLLAAERRAPGTRRGGRALTCVKQVSFVLVRFRERDDLAVLGAGVRDQPMTVLAEEAPELTERWPGFMPRGSHR